MNRVLSRVTPSGIDGEGLGTLAGGFINPVTVTSRVFTEWGGEVESYSDGYIEGTYKFTVKNEAIIPVPVEVSDVKIVGEESDGELTLVDGYSEDLGTISGGESKDVTIEFRVDIPPFTEFDEPGSGVLYSGCAFNTNPPGVVEGTFEETLKVAISDFNFSTDSVEVPEPDCSV